MKVTALISEDLINEVRRATGGKNITESITIALKSYLASRKVDFLIDQVEQNALQFNEHFTAYGIRKINRNR